MDVLLTAFGPFPGAPYNPTGPLVTTLARRRHPGVRRKAHVFCTSYKAVDRELPMLLAREQPHLLIMFGLALTSASLRIETVAHNALSGIIPDATGTLPARDRIVQTGAGSVPLPVPAKLLAAAAHAAGVPATLSEDAGRYLCNYLCWRACEAAGKPRGPRLAAFIHVPPVARGLHTRGPGSPMTFHDLVRGSEAIVQAAAAAARTPR